MTPNPRNHALLAEKRNLALLSEPARLEAWGLSPKHLPALSGVPRATIVTYDNADRLWAKRKRLFFKPAGGHGGNAVYRGDKHAKGVWADIVEGVYIAQEFAAPSRRMIDHAGDIRPHKLDIRLYTYEERRSSPPLASIGARRPTSERPAAASRRSSCSKGGMAAGSRLSERNASADPKSGRQV